MPPSGPQCLVTNSEKQTERKANSKSRIDNGDVAQHPWSFTGSRGSQPDGGRGSENCLAILNNFYNVSTTIIFSIINYMDTPDTFGEQSKLKVCGCEEEANTMCENREAAGNRVSCRCCELVVATQQ